MRKENVWATRPIVNEVAFRVEDASHLSYVPADTDQIRNVI